jgi:transcriptional regulator with XRE-family HTH domain
LTLHRGAYSLGSMEIAQQIKEARKAQGLSVYRLARESGVHPATIRKIESGSPDLRLSALRKVTDYLGLRLVVSAVFKGDQGLP